MPENKKGDFSFFFNYFKKYIGGATTQKDKINKYKNNDTFTMYAPLGVPWVSKELKGPKNQ